MQGAETAAECDGLRSKLQELATASRCRAEVVEFERVEVVALWHDLTQRPILQAVLVLVVPNREALEALHPVNSAAQVIEHRIDHLGGRALEVFANENVLRRLQSFAQCIVQEGLRLILSEAFVDLLVVELD